MTLYWLNTTYCCAGVLVDDQGIIRKTAPIFYRWRGSTLDSLVETLYRKQQMRSYCKVTPDPKS